MVTGYYEWREAAGCASGRPPRGHAAGLRHTVEELFTRRFTKAGYSRHRDSGRLGINMPVLSGWCKAPTQHAADAGYTLTGRAGRRGTTSRSAVVHWHPKLNRPRAGLASPAPFAAQLFAPSYNMTINLVHRMGPSGATDCRASFAQYQADRFRSDWSGGIERGNRLLGDRMNWVDLDAPILEYARLRARVSELERAQARASRQPSSDGRRPPMAGRAAPRVTSIPSPTAAAVWPSLWNQPRDRARLRASAGANRNTDGRDGFLGRLLRTTPVGSMTPPAGGAPPAAGPA